MDPLVFLAVLAAALFHASWNAGLKLKIDPAVAVSILAVSSGVVSLPLMAITGWPIAAAWPYLAASVIIHVGYFTALAEGYRSGDLGQVYPIARGSAPLLTMLGGLLVLTEPIALPGLLGIALSTAGILLLSLRRKRPGAELERRAVFFALVTAASIATYTLVDGVGARVSGNPHAYAVAFFVLNGITMGLVGLLRQGHRMRTALGEGWMMPLAGGILSFVSYWIALWAMTVAPIALVAAVRETSVLFAAAIGVLLLGEPVVTSRVTAAVLVVAGLVLIRLA